MKGHRRLDRLYPELTALERARLVIDAIVSGDLEDPEVRHTMPEAQRANFNKLMHLGRELIRTVRSRATQLSTELDALRARATLLRVVMEWAAERYLLFTYLEEAPRCLHCGAPDCEWLPSLQLNGPSHPQVLLRGTPEADALAAPFDVRAGELVQGLRAGIQDAWAELLALETVEPWVAERFEDGEFADRVIGRLLREVRAEIEEIRQDTSEFLGEFELPPPDPEFMAYVEGVLDASGQRPKRA